MGISDWNNFDYNIKSKIDAESFVKNNLFRLIQLFNIEDDISIEEKEEILIEYLTKYPDQIKSLNLVFPNKYGQMSIPKTNNIGGVYK